MAGWWRSQWDGQRGGYQSGWGSGGSGGPSGDRPFQYGLLEGLTRADIESFKAAKRQEGLKDAVREVLRETQGADASRHAPAPKTDLEQLLSLATPQRQTPSLQGGGASSAGPAAPPSAAAVAEALAANPEFLRAVGGGKRAEAAPPAAAPTAKKGRYDVKMSERAVVPPSTAIVVANTFGFAVPAGQVTALQLVQAVLGKKGSQKKVAQYLKDNGLQEKCHGKSAEQKARAAVLHLAESFLAQLREESREEQEPEVPPPVRL
ncbi:unnamed protein product [Prorocentrum cordatum]|uniref:Uncharacterized protein n=1 Tax=Prorocentrum cordatum TaxID=2364126 RepID=A0ABN9U6T7_9DINO|nr:unnamed protein product [Polarella glacialis]